MLDLNVSSGLNLNPILQAAQKYNVQAQSGAKEEIAIDSRAKETTEANATLEETQGSNLALVNEVSNNAILNTQNNKLKVATQLGMNLDASSEMYTTLSRDINTAYTQKKAALDEIQKKRNVGFFDNPLEFIVNQFTINDDINKHNAANDQLNAAEEQLATLNTLTQSSAVTQGVLTQSVTQASVQASADAIRDAANIKANNERLRGYAYSTDAIKAALNASKETLQTTLSVFGAQKQEESVQIALAHLQLSREEFDWKKEEKDKGKDADKYLIDTINAGRKLRLGEQADILVPGSVRANTVLSLIKSNSPAGKEFQTDYLNGEQSISTGSKLLATSPAAAIELLNTLPVNLSPAAQTTKALLNTVLSAVQQDIAQGKLDGKNKDAIHAALNAKTVALINQQASRVVPGDDTNVFNIPPIRSIISESPTVAALPVVQKILNPAIQTGVNLNDPNQVFGLLTKGIQDKTITYPEALEITNLYQVGMRVNQATRQFTTLGIVPKNSYNVDITTGPSLGFFNKDIVDMTKPDLVGRAINKYLANQATGNQETSGTKQVREYFQSIPTPEERSRMMFPERYNPDIQKAIQQNQRNP